MSQERRISAEKIVEVVQECPAGKAGAASLAQRSGVNECTVRRSMAGNFV